MSTQNPALSTEKTPLSTVSTGLSTAAKLLPLEKRALEFLSTEAMLKKGDCVVAAVSGGCDSAAMLHILCALSTELDLHILCAHVNHNLRGEESDGDEKFVLKMCEKLGVPCKIYSAPVAEYALEHRLSTEEAGRRLRYEFFEHCAEKLGENAKIATAHSLSDCAETFIFNAARGTGLSGICGIPKKRGRIIRPIIGFTRAELEEYCAQKGVCFVTDSTNLTDEYARNKIRHNVIPTLREINPSFERSLLRLENSLAEAREYIDCAARAALAAAKRPGGYAAEALAALPPAVQSAAAMLILEEYGFAADYERVRRLCGGFGGGDFQWELAKNEYLCKKSGVIFKKTASAAAEKLEERPFAEGKTALADGESLEIELLPFEIFKNSYKFKKYSLKDAFDYDTIQGVAFLRSRKEGDKADIHGGTKTLKKLFNEEKIPPEQRNGVAVIADSAGVVWVEGLGAARRARLSDSTETVAVVKRYAAQGSAVAELDCEH